MVGGACGEGGYLRFVEIVCDPVHAAEKPQTQDVMQLTSDAEINEGLTTCETA
jgi:hypothetical protein